MVLSGPLDAAGILEHLPGSAHDDLLRASTKERFWRRADVMACSASIRTYRRPVVLA